MYYSVFIYDRAIPDAACHQICVYRYAIGHKLVARCDSNVLIVASCPVHRPSGGLFDTKIVKSLAGEHTQLSRSIVRYTSD